MIGGLDPGVLAIVAVSIAMAAALYSTVGHGGASAYLAIMALFALPAEVMRPTALLLNLLVAGLASIRFVRAGQVNYRLLALFALPAAPLAYLGGQISLPAEIYRPLLGLTLIVAAARLLVRPRPVIDPRTPSWPISLALGSAIGFLSGLVGVGGGIFLSPIILLMGWEAPRRTSGVAALFIVINSLAGLIGNVSSLGGLPPSLPILAGAALLGGLIGTQLGVARLGERRILQTLGVVLAVAGARLVLP